MRKTEALHVTKHAENRLKERNGLNKKSIERISKKALEVGIKHSETKGKLNKWITSLYFYNKKANNIRLYGDKAYIFCDEDLVTIIQIPYSLMKNFKKMINK